MQSLTQGVYEALISGSPAWAGNGVLLLPVAVRQPRMRLTILDLPHAADGARACIVQQGLSDRYEAIGGDAFVSVPPGADAYVLKGAIHDWEDQEQISVPGERGNHDELISCKESISQGNFADRGVT